MRHLGAGIRVNPRANQALDPHLPCTLQVKDAPLTDAVDFVVKKLSYDLSSHGGLALVGRLFKRISPPVMVDPKCPVQVERGASPTATYSMPPWAADPGHERFLSYRGLWPPAFCHPNVGPARGAIEIDLAPSI